MGKTLRQMITGFCGPRTLDTAEEKSVFTCFYLVKLFPNELESFLVSMKMFVEDVFGCRHPELRPPAVAGTSHDERWSDGSVHGRHYPLYAQFQLWDWHGLSCGSVWAFHYYGVYQRFTELRAGDAESEI